MGLRSLALGISVTITSLLLAACQGVAEQPLSPASTQTPARATATPAATSILGSDPTATPAATSTPKAQPKKEGVPAADDITRQAPTPLPAARVETNIQHEPAATEQTGEQRPPAAQSSTSHSPPQKAVFYQQNGLTLEYYWPLDPLSNLSADETEIFAYNESGDAIEFFLPKIIFTENGSTREQHSGTWEKFASRSSWDRIEYIQIPPSPYGGESLIVGPGEKAKLHWHMEGVGSTETNQEVVFELKITTGAGTQIIAQTLVRGSEQGTISVTAAPEPTQAPQQTQPSPSHEVHVETAGTHSGTSGVLWSFNGTIWSPNGTPPSCADPFVVQTPVDLDMVTSALWPGQQRGGYVAHGGFRFDGLSADDVTVRAPIDSTLVQAGRYLEGIDEQYLLFFSVPCGFFYRFDHVRSVPDKIAEALEGILPPTTTDSRTYYLNPPLWIEQGEVVGTSVGIAPSNIFVDFGLYDVRAPNNVVPNPAWADLFAKDKEFGHYGVCFFDYLPDADGQAMRSLPTGKEGKTSDYCK